MMIVNAALLARAGYTYLGRLYSEMDCQSFVEKCLADCGLKMNLPGSNAWYRKMTWTGTPEECRKTYGKIPVGAFLFILEKSGGEPEKYKGDGVGNASHIGIYTGRGKGAIHSSASRGCVTESRFEGRTINGGWNRDGLWDRVAYDVGIVPAEGTDKAGKGEITVSEKAKVVLASGETGSTVNLRSGPGTNYGRVEGMKEVPIGTEVKVIEDKGTWTKIMIGATVGWMMSNHLEYVMEEGSSDVNHNNDGEIIDRALSEMERALLAAETHVKEIYKQLDAISQQVNVIGGINGRG